ncbi:MAG: sigma-E factor negative regulatory protein [Gammaproteobacteria bacterium]
MSDEQISALVDDALPPDETASAVDRLLGDAQARAAWSRYHLMGAALRESVDDGGLARRDAPRSATVVPFQRPAPAAPRRPAWLGLAAAAALGALVLAVAAIAPRAPTDEAPAVASGGTTVVAPGGTQVGTPVASPSPIVLPTQAESVGLAGSDVVVMDDEGYAVSVNQQAIVREAETETRLNDYVTNFNERRARQSAPGQHPYVRSVDYSYR